MRVNCGLPPVPTPFSAFLKRESPSAVLIRLWHGALQEVGGDGLDLPGLGICHQLASLPEGIEDFSAKTVGVFLFKSLQGAELLGREFRGVHLRAKKNDVF